MKYCDTCNSTYPTEFTTCPKDQSPLRKINELAPGMILREKYEVLDKIGAGGMASVYKARHLTFNEIRAIKIVSSKLADDQEFLKRFKTEAIITRKLRHPNAVQLDDFDTTEDGRPFIVMEYVQGRNLRSMLQDVGALPIQRSLNIAKQVASALGAAHKLGIVHRDIKPDNILCIPQPLNSEIGPDLVKVFDFGIAKIRDGSVERNSTQTGMVVGTPQYVSPEQASGKIGEQIDGRSDLYSLGIVLYEMLTGNLPFTSDTPIGFLIHHLQTLPALPSRLPEGVAAIVMKALEKNRDRRFQTAEEMIAALNNSQGFTHSSSMGTGQTLAMANMASAAMPATSQPTSLRTAAQSPTASGRIAQTNTQPTNLYPAKSNETPIPICEGTVWNEKLPRAARPQLPLKKILIVMATVLALFILSSGLRRARSSAAIAAQGRSDLDLRIQQEVQDALASSDSLKNDSIRIVTKDNVVVLSGKVARPYQSEIAGHLAKEVFGVKDVVNEIEVVEHQEAHEPVWRSEQGAQGNSSSKKRQPAQR